MRNRPGRLLLLLAATLAPLPGPAEPAREAAAPRPALIAPRAAQSLLLDVTRVGDRLVAVGERGHILYSDDGETWQQASVPVRATLTAVTFRDPERGWAVGHDATILHSTDGGRTWSLQHRAPEDGEPLLDVYFDADGTGFAIGAYGLCLRTENAGREWYRRQVDEEDFHLNAMAGDGRGHLYIAGEAGHLWRSADRGQTWERLPSPYEGSWFGLAVADGQLWVWGLQGRVYRSADQGQTWTRLDSGTQSTLFGGTLRDGHLLLVGASGTLVSGPAGGPLARHILPDRTLLSQPARLGDHDFAVGERGVHVLGDKP